MIELTAQAQGVLTGSFRYYLVIESWLGGELLGEVPVTSASEETDRSLNVPERVTLTVPRIVDNFSWSPVTADHPLAANGQRLRVLLGVGLGGEVVEWFQRGWFIIEDTETDGDVVNVTAVGLLNMILEARLVSPFQPTGTLVSTLRGLIEPALTAEISDDLDDRAVPDNLNYDEDRLGSINELLDAWPAMGYVNELGTFSVVPAEQSTTPVISISSADDGTVIRTSGQSTRQGAYSVVIARGTATDGGQVQAVVYDQSGGPKDIDGPFNPLPVPYFYQSPLITTLEQAQAAANTILARIQRETGLEFEVTMVPNPTLQVGDVVSLTNDDYTDLVCSIEALTLPYVASGGSMSLKVRTI